MNKVCVWVDGGYVWCAGGEVCGLCVWVAGLCVWVTGLCVLVGGCICGEEGNAVDYNACACLWRRMTQNGMCVQILYV